MEEHKESQTDNELMTKVDVDEGIMKQFPRLPDKIVIWSQSFTFTTDGHISCPAGTSTD